MPTSQTPEDLNSSQIELLLVDSHPSTTIASLGQRYKSQDRIETCQPLIDKAKNVSDDQPDEPKETGIVIRKALVPPSSKVKDTNTEKHFPEHVCWIWRWELLQLLIASGLFAAICIVLYMYSGKELPEWKNLGITLNTLISIIATFFRASIAIISSEVLSQLKWEWLSGSFRPMSDIQMFDTATRGVVGSLRLLPAIALRQPLTLEAILISFLSLGIGSFTQQSIQTYQCLQPVHLEPPPSITIAKSVNWSDFAQLTQDGRYGLNAKMSLAMKDAIIQARNISTLYYAAAIKTFRLSENMAWEVPLRTQSPERIWSAKAESFGYDWKGVTQPCLVDGKRRNLSDIPSATDHSARVYFHEDDWAEQSIDKPPGFVNITAPFECVMEFPGKLGLAFETEIEATFNFQYSAMENSYPSPLSSLLKDNRTSDNIENALKLIATRITQEIRQVSKDSDSDSDSKHLLVTGNASENRLCVQIAWKWLIFPGALLGLCAILLFAVIFRFGLSKKRRIWKSSVLPLLLKDYPGLETMDLKEIEQVAEDFEAKMQRPLD
ncbi:hypothetical protein FBULB1_11403 [Fusarium bulbicola]|nr:hypothetical protein FBULB1_11403 [Fusarium bulbicola]